MTQPDVRRPYLPLYVKDFLADEAVQLMDLDAVGAYVLLLLHQWWHGSVPAELSEIARICKRVSPAKMRRLWRVIGPKFHPHPDTPNRLVNRKLEAVRADQDAYRETKAKAGRSGGRQSWKVRSKNRSTDRSATRSRNEAPREAEPEPPTKPPTPSKAYGVGEGVAASPPSPARPADAGAGSGNGPRLVGDGVVDLVERLRGRAG